MKRFKYIFLVLLTVVSGFIGGVISNLLFKKQVAVQESEKKKVVEAQEFRLVDKDGKLLGLFGEYDGFQPPFQGLFIFDKSGDPRIVVGRNKQFVTVESIMCIYDWNGKERIALSDSGILIHDEDEKLKISLTTSGDQ